MPSPALYWTLRVKVAVWVMPPLLAVTVTVEVPVGVPGSVLWLLPPLPPPHPETPIMNAKAIRDSNLLPVRCLEAPLSKQMPARVAPKLIIHQPVPFSVAVWAAVVEMVSVVAPLPVIEMGLKLHVLSRGKPEHDAAEKLIVPLYPG